MNLKKPRCDGRSVAEDILAAKWALPVMRVLADGPGRFSYIRTAIPGVSPNILTARLRSLEEAGIVRRWTLPPPADCQVYGLTELGEAARPILRAIEEWSPMIQYHLETNVRPHF